MSSRLPIHAVLFDWDGTLLDSYHAGTHAYQKMFAAFGKSCDEAQLKRIYSPNWHLVYRKMGIAKKDWPRADRLWRRHYRSHSPELVPAARGVLQTLHLRGYQLGLITSGNRSRVLPELKRLRLEKLFQVKLFCEHGGRKKPDPAVLHLALRRLRAAAAECVYVGDSPDDIEMARRAGVLPIAVLGPYPTYDRLRRSRARYLLKDLSEILPLLDRMKR
jgi:HAD superfamily hydrolase (TIGR01509 family)